MDINLMQNPTLLKALKVMHSIVENDDLESKRASEKTVGDLFNNNKSVTYTNGKIKNIPFLWTKPVRVHRKDKIILYCHGGGYIAGGTHYAKSVTTKLADLTSLDVISFDYRLAPEHPYPAAIKDALTIWDYLMYLGYGAKDIIVAGDSAGGNLALELILKIKSQKRQLPCACVLFSPWTDLTMSGPSYEECVDIDPVLTKEYIAQAISYYLNNETGLATKPQVSPLYAKFDDFPPTLIQVGTHDLLYSDSTMLYDKMKEFDVDVKLETFEGLWHVFQMTPFKTAFDAVNSVAEFILKYI